MPRCEKKFIDSPIRVAYILLLMLLYALLGNEAYQTLEMDCPLSGWYDNRRRRRPAAVT